MRDMVTPPKLTEEQRKEALAKAAAARKARSELKQKIRIGDKSLQDVLNEAADDPIIGGTKVLAVLEALPGTGKVKARKAMEDIGIVEGRKIAGLGSKQRVKLLEYFSS